MKFYADVFVFALSTNSRNAIKLREVSKAQDSHEAKYDSHEAKYDSHETKFVNNFAS